MPELLIDLILLQRRLAQNCEAACKSHLRKKAYVQQLETSRLKLAQLELEIDRTKQGLYTGSPLSAGHSGSINSGIISFEIEYGLWVELQEKKIYQLRNVLQAQTGDTELRVHVEGGLAHFSDLFHMKAEAAKVDVFHVMQGIYRSPVERFFLWIGGFRPSEIIQFLFDAATGNCVELAIDHHGCCVLQKCLNHSDDEQRHRLVQEIMSNSLIFYNQFFEDKLLMK